MKFPRFVLTYPDDLTGGIMLFGAVVVIGIFSLYVAKRAYQASTAGPVITGGIKQTITEDRSKAKLCRQFGGEWKTTSKCCWRSKKTLPRSIKGCS